MKMKKKKRYMMKKEHLYTFDEQDRLVELNKIRITKIPIEYDEQTSTN